MTKTRLTTSVVNRALAQRVDNIVAQGLVKGLGIAKPGAMCVEAAVCYALELPHDDNPSCVGSAVRAFKIRLNDASWSSNAARTKGLRKLAVAQLGSDTINQTKFVELVVLGVIREILPPMLRQIGLLTHAEACEHVMTLMKGKKAAADAGAAAAYDAADAGAAAAYVADAARAAAGAAAGAARAAYDAAGAADAGAAAAYVARAADADAAAAADFFLFLASDICLRALVELRSPGVEWLDVIPADV